MIQRKKSVVSLSGGLDSTTLLVYLIQEGKDVFPVSFQYPSKHNQYELWAARAIVERLGLLDRWYSIDVSPIFSSFKSDLLTGQGEIPEGHYADPSMRRTVVPCRNLIFLSILSGYAQSIGAQEVALAVHAGDHPIYPDCRPEFMITATAAVKNATEDEVLLRTPFLHLDKTDIVQEACRIEAPLDLTRTCYKDQPDPCGKCGSCIERAEAFQRVGIPDPGISP